MTDIASFTNDALAAAVAAATELAMNGGSFLFSGEMAQPTELSETVPMMIQTRFCSVSRRIEQEETETCFSLPASSSEDEKDVEEEDSERRMARSRERNREHARRTRLRKKAQLQVLQSKVKELQAKSQVLKQSLEECSIASILVGLSSGNQNCPIESLLLEATKAEGPDIVKLVGSKRKRFVSEDMTEKPTAQPLRININGETTLIGGGRTNINWKSGVYSDGSGAQRQLTQGQLEGLR
jgi:hypothetical protein